MGTLAEIETAADRLPLAEQEQLLRHLEVNVRRRRATPTSREDWMRRLDALRGSLGSGALVQSSEQLFEDLRED